MKIPSLKPNQHRHVTLWDKVNFWSLISTTVLAIVLIVILITTAASGGTFGPLIIAFIILVLLSGAVIFVSNKMSNDEIARLDKARASKGDPAGRHRA
jgi:anti-sigma-K factor RskA